MALTTKNLKTMAENKNEKQNLRYYFELQYGKEDNPEYLRSKMYCTKIDCLKALITKYDQEKNKGFIEGRLTDTLTGETFMI